VTDRVRCPRDEGVPSRLVASDKLRYIACPTAAGLRVVDRDAPATGLELAGNPQLVFDLVTARLLASSNGQHVVYDLRTRRELGRVTSPSLHALLIATDIALSSSSEIILVDPITKRRRTIPTDFALRGLKEDEIVTILERALHDKERGLGDEPITVDEGVLPTIARFSNGDARAALNLLELTTAAAPREADGSTRRLSLETVQQSVQRRALLYDKSGEEHYNIMSALHKSMRNSDPDASVYWLARMLESGEDPLYVARRLIRFASEDIGNADPQALVVAVAAKDAVHFIGMPEGNTALAQAAIYLATAPKSNAVYVAYGQAAEDALQQIAEPVPLHIRNAPTKLMKDLNYGKGYKYAHNEAEGIADMDCLPPSLSGKTYYQPTDRGFEDTIRKRIEEWKQLRKKT
jgi:putative ATPase